MMTPRQEAAAFTGLAMNMALSLEERLQCALQAVKILESVSTTPGRCEHAIAHDQAGEGYSCEFIQIGIDFRHKQEAKAAADKLTQLTQEMGITDAER